MPAPDRAEKLFEYNFKIIYQSEVKNAKIDVFIYTIDNSLIIFKNNRFKYQYQIILTFFRLKIHNLKVDEKVFIYKSIQIVNKVDEKFKCFHRVICKKRNFSIEYN